jgi:hypothetical protein
MQSVSVSLRLSKDVWSRFSAESQARAVSLASLLRSYLERQDELLGRELRDLHRCLEQATASSAEAGCDESTKRAVLLEIVFLLRCVAGPERVRMVQAEVERRGLDVWS